MKTPLKLAVGAGIILAGLILLRYRYKKSKSKRVLRKVANEGYETAIDILYPAHKTPGNRLHYGPVISARAF